MTHPKSEPKKNHAKKPNLIFTIKIQEVLSPRAANQMQGNPKRHGHRRVFVEIPPWNVTELIVTLAINCDQVS